jgi:hypothetical protein
MGNVPQARAAYREAREERSRGESYSGPPVGEVRLLKAEADAAAVYIRALEEADAIRKNAEADAEATEAHKHRKPGPAL